MVVMRREYITAVMPPTFHFGNDIEALIVIQELVLNISSQGFGIPGESVRHPHDGVVPYPLTICLVEL